MAQNDPDRVRAQYRDPGNLKARASLHERFSTNPHGWVPWLLDQFDLADDACVLDVGCGPAFLWRARVPARWRVVCSDLSVGMVTEARGVLDDDRFSCLVADAQSLPFAGGSFDAVVANHMLYHVPDLPRAMGEMARVLAPGGRLFAATNGARHLTEIGELLGRESGLNVRAFGLETGPAALEPCFGDVEVLRYEDALRVTEVEPLLDYICSMGTFWADIEGERDEIRRRIADQIDRTGSFDIQKDAGLIRARKR